MMIKKLGLISGSGNFPVICAKAARDKGIEVVAVALKEETDPLLEEVVDKIYWISVGELNKLIGIFKSERVRKAIMAGKIKKVRIFRDMPKLDSASSKLLERARNKNDTILLRNVARILKLFGVTLIDSTIFLKDHFPESGVVSKRQPTIEEWKDIRFGYSLAKKISRLDIGQTVVVKSRTILAIESIEGTDEAILRGGKLGNGNVVVVKTARPHQDKRFDIPTVGPQTIKSLGDAGGRVLAIEAKKTLLLEKDKCADLADANNLTLVVV